ncbi:MAG: YceI family protein [Hyphomonadaceae bacterium]|nr:MAG: cytochrome b561 [Caulobacteraceae bacterium]MBT9445174.1 YceI family protein [Hyphomonadaceae bacterium]TPW07712.1 MAG: cytochrome b561 [Alphaproteobacteria bacterium]
MKRWTAALFALAALPALAQPTPKATARPPAAKAAAVVAAPAWTVDQRASSIGFAGAMDGTAFRGAFSRWSAAIRFDPANLAGSSARVIVEPASVASGDGSRDATLREGDWFDTARNPQVIFQSTSFRTTGPNRYEAIGTLNVKGRAIPLTLPFTLNIAGAQADMRATISLDRTRLGLGVQFDPSGAQVAKAVTVSIVVKATRAQ